MPHALLSLAGRALRSATAEVPDEAAFARVLSRTGRWIVLHGAVLQSEGRRRVAVIVEPGHPARISPLLMAAYGLSDREQEVARLVLSGAATGEIATALHISPHTIQQHLKAIFDKTGVRSRRDLVAKVFFAHYEPRLRQRTARAGRAAATRRTRLRAARPLTDRSRAVAIPANARQLDRPPSRRRIA